MRSILAGLRDLIIPWGAPAGSAAMQILTTPPAEIATVHGLPYIGGIVWRLPAGAVPQYHFYGMWGTGDTQPLIARGTYDPVDGVTLFELIGVGEGASTITWGDGSAEHIQIETGATLTARGDIEARGTLATVEPLQLYAEDASSWEDWTALTLQNGWTTRSGYPDLAVRLAACPPWTAQLVGQIQSGTTTNGTTIATLPAGYRPTTEKQLLCAYSTGAHVFRVVIATSGAVQVYDLTTAGIASINILYPLDR